MPQEFDQETAMGLFANIPTIEAQRSLEFARGIAIALGDERQAAQAAFQVTGSARLARDIEIAALRQKALKSHG